MWSEWSACSASCGGGQQFRTKICDRSDCDGKGKMKMARACNTQPCQEWTCWTEWSTCSVTCGIGIRRRSRKCMNESKNCDGNHIEEEICEMPPCESMLTCKI